VRWLLKIVKEIVEKNPIVGCNLNSVIHKILCVIRKKSILYIKYYALFLFMIRIIIIFVADNICLEIMEFKKYVFDPYPLEVTMQRLANNLKCRRLEKKFSTKTLSEMSGVPTSTIQHFELKHSISLVSFVKLAKALGYSEEIIQLLAEPKYDTMEELLEINKNSLRKRGV